MLENINNITIDNFIKLLQAEGMEVRQAGNPPLQLLPFFSNPNVYSHKLNNQLF